MRIHQKSYVTQILERFSISGANLVCTLVDPHATLSLTEDNELQNIPYREAVGSLMFLAVTSRPDIAFAVSTLSRFFNKYNQNHWNAVKRVFKYLVGTAEIGITYKSGGNDFVLEGYLDADFADDVETRRSTTGYVFMLANDPVTWASQRQRLVTLSTTEAKYVVATIAAKEAV